MRFVHTCTCTKIKDSERFKNIQKDSISYFAYTCSYMVFGMYLLKYEVCAYLHMHQNQRFRKIQKYSTRLSYFACTCSYMVFGMLSACTQYSMRFAHAAHTPKSKIQKDSISYNQIAPTLLEHVLR